ncbi:MAG: hypothetical protein H7174_09155 [Flavobacterium sp.]|nr:hypothetical protein [Flavobacterium sp.]
MEELDLLKKDWQKADNFNQFSEKDIYNMLQKKSTSIVRWLLIISVLEFCLWTFISFFSDNDDYFDNKEMNTFMLISKYLEYIGYGVILLFIYLLFKKYKKISVTESTKQLMTDILNTRKIVQYYVWYNLIILVLCVFLGVYFAVIINPQSHFIMDKILSDSKYMIGGILFLILITVLFLGIFWLFYRLLYGILLKRLYANYKELQKIDL